MTTYPKKWRTLQLAAFVATLIITGTANSQGLQFELAPILTFPEDETSEVLLASPRDLEISEEYIWVLDWQQSAVFKYSHQGDFLVEYRQPGIGPGEMDGPTDVVLSGGRLYTLNGRNHELSIFDSEEIKYIDGFKLTSVSNQIAVSDSSLITENSTYLNSEIRGFDYDGEPLNIYDFEGRLIKQFGIPFGQSFSLPKFSYSLLDVHNNNIIRVSKYYPFIQIYDLSGEYKKEIQLSKIEEYKSYTRGNYNAVTLNAGRSSGFIPLKSLFQAVDLINDNIFILLFSTEAIIIDQYNYDGNLLGTYKYDFNPAEEATPLAWDFRVRELNDSGDFQFIISFRNNNNVPLIGLFQRGRFEDVQ